ncbi:MAG: DUF692 family protein [Alphaproteobacteria bacterium]|nr:DUF692 family protein [Alphaproteobacteria bacterium]
MPACGLGVGVVWWPPLDALCRPGEGLIDVIEAEPEAFWIPAPSGDGFRSLLADALSHLPQPKLLHGVGAPVGGTCPPPRGHAAAFARDVAALHPPFVSEHLSFRLFRERPGGPAVAAGFLLPPLQSERGMRMAVDNIHERRAALGSIPLAVETPVSYLPPAPGEWPDGAFIAAVAEAADCGILLDLHNVLCNARNGRQSVAAFCAALPPERVWELHLAGGERESGFHLDAHAGLVEPELWEIAAGLVPRLSQLQAIVFEIMPERIADIGLAPIGKHLGRMRELWNRRAQDATADLPRRAPAGTLPLVPETWEMLLGCAFNGRALPPLDGATAAWWHAAAPSVALYRTLVGEGRASAVSAAAPRTVRLLLAHGGEAAARGMLAAFWHQSPPGYTAAEEARALFRFLAATHPALPGLAEAMASDAAVLDEVG